MESAPTSEDTVPNPTPAPAASVFLTSWWASSESAAATELDRLADIWDTVDLSGIRQILFYQSVDGATCLLYVECDPAQTMSPRENQLPADFGGHRLSEFRRERTIVVDAHLLAEIPSPGEVVVVASFDVDGPERQRVVIDSVVERIAASQASDQQGLAQADFHTSVDGTRVLNFALWESDEAHESFLDSRSRHTNLRVTTETPGVRPIGFTRYHLKRSRIGSVQSNVS